MTRGNILPLLLVILLSSQRFYDCSVIFQTEVDRLKITDDSVLIINYIDIPDGGRESVKLSCETPLADSYDWKIYAKMGAPYAGHMDLGSPKIANFEEPWIATITQMEYPWPLLLVVSAAKVERETLISYIWVIMKMKSPSDVPYHPVICWYDGAQCLGKTFDCSVDQQGLYYRGTMDRDYKNVQCQSWMSKEHPHQMSKNYMKYWYQSPINNDYESGHNYCRNPAGEKGTYCLKGKKSKKYGNGHFAACTLPLCHSCMLGDGKGNFPGVKPLKWGKIRHWEYPEANTKSRWTTIEEYKNGKKVYRKCRKGKSSHWAENQCKLRGKVHTRARPGNVPTCLAVKADSVVDEKDYHESVWSSEYKFVPCIAPQCTVRQVWFLLVTPVWAKTLIGSNVDFLEIPVLLGKTKSIKFYHFGTNFCDGMKLESESAVKVFLRFFKLRCKPTPQQSEIIITNPTKDFEGKYTLKYHFREGNKMIENVEYKVNFKVVVKQPTSIYLTPVDLCPGYAAKTHLQIKGSFKVDTNSLKWSYSTDKKQWKELGSHFDNFHLSLDRKSLTLKNLAAKIYLKVIGRSGSGNLLTETSVTILKVPLLVVKDYSLEVEEGGDATFTIVCNSLAETVWIFKGRTIDKESFSERNFIFRSRDRKSVV